MYHLTGEFVIGRTEFNALKQSAVTAITTEHARDPLAKGMSRDALAAAAFRNVPLPIFDSVLADLQREAIVSIDGDAIRRASHSTKLGPEEREFTDRFVAAYKASGLEVLKFNDVVADSSAGLNVSPQTIAKLVRHTLDDGRIVKVTDEFYFDAGSVADLIERTRKDLTGEFDVAAFKDVAGVSRKYAIPLLEYLDRTRITARVGDRRVVIT
jgi:selenocysteine-specific elongation factor